MENSISGQEERFVVWNIRYCLEKPEKSLQNCYRYIISDVYEN